MSREYHNKFIDYIKHLIEIEKHSMEKIAEKTGIPLEDLKKIHEEDDIAGKDEFNKLLKAFKNKKD